MCYFLTAITDQELTQTVVDEYRDGYVIMIDDITSYVRDRKEGMFYYQIHRQCSCDFVYKGQNAEELRDLFVQLSGQGQLMISYILDTGELDDVGTDVQIAVERYPTREVTMGEFLEEFPLNDPGNVTYVVRSVEPTEKTPQQI